MSKYTKTIVALVTGLIGWATFVVSASSWPTITAPEWITLATTVAVAFGVYAAPNVP